MLSLTGLIIVIFYGFCDANLGYAVIFPSEVYSKQSELVCLHMVGMVGETSVQLVLQKATSNITLFESNLQENTYFHCIPFQVPEPSDGNEEVATIHAAINHAGNSIYKKSKLLLKGKQAATFVQTDKAIYKPGQTVKFRVVSLDENFQPGKNQLSAVKLQDPEKNLIGQWLNVSLSQGIAELSLPLSSEPLLGEYSIHVKDKVHTFSVEEYVLPKFEVTLHFSKPVVITDEKCTLQLCGRYTYGKPVKGNYKIQVCRSKVRYYYTPSPDVPCVDFTGELDISGCSTVQVPLDTFHLHRRLQMKLLGTATITEEGTGIELSTTTDTRILDENIKVYIFGSDTTYKRGIPMRIQVKVSDARDTVIPGKQVHLTCSSKLDRIVKTLVTGPDGIASFNIDDTTGWKGTVYCTATVNQTDYTPPDQSDSKVPSNVFARLELSPFRSYISSFIKIHPPGAILPCDGQQEVKVDYIIKQKQLQEGVSHLHLHYLVITRFSIKYSGQLEIPIRSIDKDERGDVVLKLLLTADMAPTFSILGYILFPNQDAAADSVQFNMEKCFRNKVSVKFLPGEVLPKSDVSLQVEAAPGSLCGLRVVDKSVVLMKPDNELTATKVFDLFPISSSHTYNRQVVDETECKSRISYYFSERDWNKGDVCIYFENLSLKIMTSARIGKSPKKESGFIQQSRPGGHVNVTVTTEALDTQDLCHNEVPIVPKQGSIDTVVKPLLVQPGGLMEEKSYSALLCSQGEDDSKVEEISLKIPENILKDSERANIVVIGDLMGTAMQNLDRLLAMPYGCGEQNMVLFAPNIFILQYLEKTHQLNSEIKNKATTFLESGYQRELTYKRDDGSYSAFGKSDSSGNTWLTAFVVKSFSKARPYIFIDENHLKHSFSWLKKKQQVNGCFRSVGRLFNNAMKGGVTDEVSLSTYVTIALLEAGVLIEDPMVRDAVSCLRTAAETVTNVYSQALLAYAFTLSGDTKLREAMMDKLEAQVVRGNREQHWERLSKPQSEDSYWSRAPSAEVEMTSYVLLAVLSGPTQDLGKGSEIVNWLSKQQNPYGGFSSTQDTVVALQALAKYAEATFSDKGDVTVTVSSKTEFMKQFHVNNNNRLLLQSTSLPTVPGEYTVRSSGSGCFYVQTVLRYNVPPPRQEETFAIKVEVQSNECAEESMTKLELTITARYTGSRQKSNMVVIDVKMLSGYIPLKSSVRKLEENLIKRSDIQMDMVTLYLEELGQESINLSFFIEQDSKVKNLKPAIVKIYDYYETDEHAVTEYNSPCSGEDKSNTNQGTESKN
ncbi:alpha-2-macroglobulin-like isoform X4 [Bufo gargarizans]|uniref:alpha-2-macroglobulin-like isoform X4 n=1 Tax=Bufo gargarizans TaxID=30331 RepID=UPI001CF5C757|nr:alpha-2-macroglobulin-like isoform X4 [Bufo gargarizans]